MSDAENPLHARPVDPILRDIPDSFESARLTLRVPRPGDGAQMLEAVSESLASLRNTRVYAKIA